jgi:hypothetical protein
MSVDNAERRLRAAYQATTEIQFDDRVSLPAGTARRPVARWLLPAAAAAVVIAGVGTSFALIHGSSGPSTGTAAASSSVSTRQSSAPPSSAGPSSAGSSSAGASSSAGQAGSSRPWRLFVHCGAPVIMFDGRAWAPEPPAPGYPGPRPVNGITTYTGYTTGTLTVLSADRLRFTASDTVSPYTVNYAPAPPSASTTAPVCA